jgi:hypothetical protein
MSGLSYRAPILRSPFNRRNIRPASFRLLYNSLSYSHGRARFFFGGTTVYPRPKASRRVFPSSQARSINK